MSRPFLIAAVILSAASAPLAGSDPAMARPKVVGVQPAPVSVDVSRLRAFGLGPTADLIASAIGDELRGYAVRGGRLVVRVTGFSMNAYAGTEAGSGGGGGGGGGGSGGAGGGGAGENDYIEGEALVLGAGGEILSRQPIVFALPSNSGGPSYLPGSEQRRVIAISRDFARWVRRDLG